MFFQTVTRVLFLQQLLNRGGKPAPRVGGFLKRFMSSSWDGASCFSSFGAFSPCNTHVRVKEVAREPDPPFCGRRCRVPPGPADDSADVVVALDEGTVPLPGAAAEKRLP